MTILLRTRASLIPYTQQPMRRSAIINKDHPFAAGLVCALGMVGTDPFSPMVINHVDRRVDYLTQNAHLGEVDTDGACFVQRNAQTQAVKYQFRWSQQVPAVCTVMFWMKILAFSTNGATCFTSVPSATIAAQNAFAIGANSNNPTFPNTMYMESRASTPSSVHTVSFPQPSSNAWHHFAFVFDRTTTTPSKQAWVDGKPQTLTNNQLVWTTVQPGLIDGQITFPAVSSSTDTMKMRNVMVWNRILSPGEIRFMHSRPWEIMVDELDELGQFIYTPSSRYYYVL